MMLIAPLVTYVYPSNGPMMGGRRITVRGVHLGTSLEDIERITIGSIPCTAVDYESTFSVRCVTGALRQLPPPRNPFQDGLNWAFRQQESPQKPVEAPVIVVTKSGGRGDQYHRPGDTNALFTYNPPPLVHSVDPRFLFSTVSSPIRIYGSFLGISKDDIKMVTVAGRICDRPQYFNSNFISCMSPVLYEPIPDAQVIVETESGGRGSSVTGVGIRFQPECNKYTDADMCSVFGCAWCTVTALCVSDKESCPAICLRHGNLESCAHQSTECHWCPSSAACLNSTQDCPPGCFLYPSPSACASDLAKRDGCEWCFATSTCMERAGVESCPKDCSLVGTAQFSCGSVILLVLLGLLLLMVAFGFWILVYYVKRDERLASNLRRYAKRMHPSGWQSQQSGSGEPFVSDGEHSPLLSSQQTRQDPSWTPSSSRTVGGRRAFLHPAEAQLRKGQANKRVYFPSPLAVYTSSEEEEAESPRVQEFPTPMESGQGPVLDDMLAVQPWEEPPNPPAAAADKEEPSASAKLVSLFHRRRISIDESVQVLGDGAGNGGASNGRSNGGLFRPNGGEKRYSEDVEAPAFHAPNLSEGAPPSSTLLSALVTSLEQEQLGAQNTDSTVQPQDS